MNALIETPAAYDLVDEEEMSLEEYGLREQREIEKDLAKQQAECAEKGKVIHLIAPFDWVGFSDQRIDGYSVLRPPTSPTKFVSHWSMPEGGTMRIVRDVTRKDYTVLKDWQPGQPYDAIYRWDTGGEDKVRFTGEYWEKEIRVEVLGNTGRRFVVRGSGTLVSVWGWDSCVTALVTSASMADDMRSAMLATLKRINDCEPCVDNVELDALRAVSSACYLCRRPLKDEIRS